MRCTKCQSELRLRDRKVNKMWQNYHWCDSCELEGTNPSFVYVNPYQQYQIELLLMQGYYLKEAIEEVGGKF